MKLLQSLETILDFSDDRMFHVIITSFPRLMTKIYINSAYYSLNVMSSELKYTYMYIQCIPVTGTTRY